MGHATTTIAEALAAAITEQRSIVAKRFSRAKKGDVGAVHRGRVASRRMREALIVAITVGAPGGVDRLRRDVRFVTRALGPVREIDVVIEEFEAAQHRHDWPSDRVAAVQRRLEQERERRRAEMAETLGDMDRSWLRDRAKAAAAEIGRTPTERDHKDWWRALALHVIERTDDVVHAIEECGTLYAPDRLHRVRISIKKLRYAVEFLCEPSRPDVKHALKVLKRAQKKFGHLHDVQMLLARIQSLASGGRRNALTPGFRAMVEALERDCRHIHGRLLPYFPKLTYSLLALRRDLTARLRQRRMPMAKAGLQARGARMTGTGRRNAAAR
jgi:CHAD domain-containing protein